MIKQNSQRSRELLDYLESKRNILKDPEAYVKMWAVESSVSFNITGQNSLVLNGQRIQKPLEAMFEILWLEYERHVREYKEHAGVHIRLIEYQLNVIRESTMLKAFNQLYTTSIEAQKEQIKVALAYTGASQSGLEQWLHALTGEVKETDLAVMQHFLWAIKRRMNGLSSVYLKVPVVYGAKQQTGKSTAIRKLLGPINAFKLDRRVSEVLDERNFKSLGSFLVCFLDEMAGMQRTEIEALKHVITADNLTYRPMRTNHSENVFVTCSFIGASNKPLRELVFDTTGQARFWELEAVDDIDHATINGINYLGIWQSIDENLPEGYIKKALPQIIEVQQAETMEDSLSIFLEDCSYIRGVSEKFINNTKLYNAYQEFCIKVGDRPKNESWFGRCLNKYGLKRKKRNGIRGYFVNKEFLGANEGSTALEGDELCPRMNS